MRARNIKTGSASLSRQSFSSVLSRQSFFCFFEEDSDLDLSSVLVVFESAVFASFDSLASFVSLLLLSPSEDEDEDDPAEPDPDFL